MEQHDRYTDGSPRSPETLSPTERADWVDDTHSAVCLAVLRRDGFVSLDAGADGGYLLTKPLKPSGGRLLSQPGRRETRKRASGGRRPIGPRCCRIHERGTPFRSSVTPIRLPVSWKQSKWADLGNRTVRLKVHLNQASLYAVWTE